MEQGLHEHSPSEQGGTRPSDLVFDPTFAC